MVFGAAAACRGKHRLQPCEPKPRPAEARRIYKSPFLTGLAPLASARELLRHRSTASDKKPVPVSLPNQNRKLVAARATLRIAKPQKNSDQTTANEQRFSFNPPAPLRRQRIAESTNHTDKSRNPCHSGCEVAESEDNKNRTNTNRKHLRLKSCRQAKTPYDRPSPSPAKSAARGIDKNSNLPFRGAFYTIGSSISVILITQMDFLIINSVQNLRGGDFLYLCIVRTARWTFGHWDEDATHILRGTARPLVGRCFS